MAQFSITEICTAISDRLRGLSSFRRIEDITEITETMPPGDLPLAVVYPENQRGAVNSNTQMNTFGGGARRPVIQEEPVIHIDVYIALIGEANLAQVIRQLLACWDELVGVLRSETEQPYFGTDQIKAFTWTVSRVELRFAGNRYWGVSCELTITAF